MKIDLWPGVRPSGDGYGGFLWKDLEFHSQTTLQLLYWSDILGQKTFETIKERKEKGRRIKSKNIGELTDLRENQKLPCPLLQILEEVWWILGMNGVGASVRKEQKSILWNRTNPQKVGCTTFVKMSPAFLDMVQSYKKGQNWQWIY